jgi:hypothetical protein
MTNDWGAVNAQVVKPPFAKEQMPKKHFLRLPKAYLDLNQECVHSHPLRELRVDLAGAQGGECQAAEGLRL